MLRKRAFSERSHRRKASAVLALEVAQAESVKRALCWLSERSHRRKARALCWLYNCRGRTGGKRALCWL
jgi:hypothetical protein